MKIIRADDVLIGVLVGSQHCHPATVSLCSVGPMRLRGKKRRLL
jgi:hypothetical protein